MANLTTKFTTILFLAMLLLHSQPGTSSSEDDDMSYDEDDEEYVLDTPNNNNLGRSKSRFLASALVIKKGTRCDRVRRNVCNGVRANKGKSLLFCCKKHCRNILGDRNNCGRCGRRCRFGQRCCGGRCTNVLFNRQNCGKCGRRCRRGDSCTRGICGDYAN